MKMLKIGDRVEFHKGGFGRVIAVYGSSGDILWDDTRFRGNPANSDVPGKNKSITIPLQDMGKEFNPIIRRVSGLDALKNELLKNEEFKKEWKRFDLMFEVQELWITIKIFFWKLFQ